MADIQSLEDRLAGISVNDENFDCNAPPPNFKPKVGIHDESRLPKKRI